MYVTKDGAEHATEAEAEAHLAAAPFKDSLDALAQEFSRSYGVPEGSQRYVVFIDGLRRVTAVSDPEVVLSVNGVELTGKVLQDLLSGSPTT